MAVKKYKPTSAGRRQMATSSFEEITRTEPEKSLLEPVKRTGGRNNRGRITTRHQGGGHKRRYRRIDFKRVKDGVTAKVAADLVMAHRNRIEEHVEAYDAYNKRKSPARLVAAIRDAYTYTTTHPRPKAPTPVRPATPFRSIGSMA